MDFGVVLQTNPPAWRVVDLAKRAELLGFSHVWTFDSHLLWEEPFVIYSQILAATRQVIGRPDGDQPGHPRLDGDGVAVRHAQRDVRQPHRLRHRPRRLRGAGHQRQADDAGHAARGDRTSSGSWPTAGGRLQGQPPALPVGGRQPARRVGRRLRAEGAAPSPARSATASSSSSPTPTSRRGRSRPCATAAEAAGRDPADGHDLRGRARLRRRRPRPPARPVPLVRRHGRQPRGRHRRPLRRRRRRRCPQALTDYIKGRQGYDYNEHGRAGNTHTDFVPDEIVDRFCLLGPAERARRAAAGAEGTSASTSSPSTCSTTRRTTTLAGLRRAASCPPSPTTWRPSPSGASTTADEAAGAASAASGRCSARSLVWSLLWEGYKALGQADGRPVIGLRRCRPAPTTPSMPHVWTSCSRFGDPELRGVEHAPSARSVLEGMLVHVPAWPWSASSSASSSAWASPSSCSASASPSAACCRTSIAVADRARSSRWPRSSSAGAASCQLFGLEWQPWMSVVGHRRVPRLLPGRRRRAARPAVADRRRRSS